MQRKKLLKFTQLMFLVTGCMLLFLYYKQLDTKTVKSYNLTPSSDLICEKYVIKEKANMSASTSLQTRDKMASPSTYMPMYRDIAKTHQWSVSDQSYEKDILAKCSKLVYDDPSTLPTLSVIITFHQTELLTHILHTVHSIVQHTPQQVIKEIILIADNSKKVEHQDVLRNYVNAIFPGVVKIHRSPISLGLIKARQLGVEMSTADVVCGLDAHMEVQKGWIEPILQEIKNNRKTMATPYLDWMKPNPDGTWVYEHGSSRYKTVWFWADFFFTFMELPNEFKSPVNQTAPVVSPCNVGIFVIDRKFFHEIGGFDIGMQFWGGENIDLTLRVFLFGGRHIHLPCSHVAHLEAPGQRDYRSVNTYDKSKNYIRIVETWFTEEYKEAVYYYNPSWKGKYVGDLSDRLMLKKKATHNFTYYMDHIFPELKAPMINSFAWGGLRNLGMSLLHREINSCAVVDFSTFTLKTINCNAQSDPHTMGIFWTSSGELRVAGHIVHDVDGQGVTGPGIANYLSMYGTNYITRYLHYKNGLIKLFKEDQNIKICLTVVNAKTHPKLTSTQCNSSDPYQLWRFKMYTPRYLEFTTKYSIPKHDGTLDMYYKALKTFEKHR